MAGYASYGTRYATRRDGTPGAAEPPPPPLSHWQRDAVPGDLLRHLGRVSGAVPAALHRDVRAWIEDGVPPAVLWGYLEHGGQGADVLDLHSALGVPPVAPAVFARRCNWHLIGHALGMALVVFDGVRWVTYGVIKDGAPVCRLVWEDDVCHRVVPARKRPPALLPPPPPPAVLTPLASPVTVALRGATVQGGAAYKAVTAASMSEVLRSLPPVNATLPVRGRWRAAVQHLVTAGVVTVPAKLPRGALGKAAVPGLGSAGLAGVIEGDTAQFVERMAVPGTPWAELARQLFGTRANRTAAAAELAERIVRYLGPAEHVALDFEWHSSLTSSVEDGHFIAETRIEMRDGARMEHTGLWKRTPVMLVYFKDEFGPRTLMKLDKPSTVPTLPRVTHYDGQTPVFSNEDVDGGELKKEAGDNGGKAKITSYTKAANFAGATVALGGDTFVTPEEKAHVVVAAAGVTLPRWSSPVPTVLVVVGSLLYSGRYTRTIMNRTVRWDSATHAIVRHDRTHQLYLVALDRADTAAADLKYCALAYAPCAESNVWREYADRGWHDRPGVTVRPDRE